MLRQESDDVEAALRIAARMCVSHEGFRARPYLCPAGVPTIGLGATIYEDGRRVTMLDAPIDQARARELCAHHLRVRCLPVVLRVCPVLRRSGAGRLAAVLSWAYNVGEGRLEGSGLARELNAGRWSRAADELRKWNRAGGVVLPGLVRRRDDEARMLEGAE